MRRLDEVNQRLEGEQATRQAAEMCVLLMKKDVEQTQQVRRTTLLSHLSPMLMPATLGMSGGA